MISIRIQCCYAIYFVAIRVRHQSNTLGHILFLVIYHWLLFAYKFELIWI